MSSMSDIVLNADSSNFWMVLKKKLFRLWGVVVDRVIREESEWLLKIYKNIEKGVDIMFSMWYNEIK